MAGRRVTWFLVAVAVIVTIASGVDYFVRARERLHMPAAAEADGDSSLVPVERGTGENRRPRD